MDSGPSPQPNSRLRTALQEEEERRQSGAPPGVCIVCGRPPGAPSPVGCQQCGGKTCKGGQCSRQSSLGWTCVLCHVKRDLQNTSGSWFNQKSESDVDEKKNSSEPAADNETIQVREFIEKLVETLVGGPLDGVTVGKLTNHKQYLGMFSKYHGVLCQSLARLGFALQLSLASQDGTQVDSPSSAHAALKKLVDRIVTEAMALPDIKEKIVESNATAGQDEDFSNKSYEDILATAILNKVIDKFQTQNGRLPNAFDRNSNLVRVSNSIDDLHSSGDWSDTRTEPLSLTIEERIEEITTTYESSDEDERKDLAEEQEEVKSNRRVPFPELGMDILEATAESDDDASSESEDRQSSATELITSTNSWEENWLFQKKKLRTTPSAHHPVPVPMLVPNPSQDFRALIGGVDADDLSDMSECSDSALEDVVMVESEVDTKLTQQIVDALNQEDELPAQATVEQQAEQQVSEVFQAKEQTISPVDSLESEESPSQSLAQQDRECGVEFDSVHQIKPPVPLPRNIELINAEPVVTEKPPICPIAEREKAKWNNAIEMKDNPYSPENIAKRDQRRLQELYRPSSSRSGSSADFGDELEEDLESQDVHRYGRDYYVRSAKSPTGEFKSRSTVSSPRSLDDSSEVSCSRPRSLQDLRAKRKLKKDQARDNTFDVFKKLSASNQHFSKVFQTSLPVERQVHRKLLDTKYQYGTHSLRLAPRTKHLSLFSSSFEIGSLQERKNTALSDIEQRSLHADPQHAVLRARGASPNFMLNPVFEPQEDPITPHYQDRADAQGRQPLGGESGYGSGDSSDWWRLSHPATPEDSKEPVTQTKPRVLVRSNAVEAVDITLPSVKLLAKQFTKEEVDAPTSQSRDPKLENTTPVSQIISTLTLSKPTTPQPTNMQEVILKEVEELQTQNKKKKPEKGKENGVNGAQNGHHFTLEYRKFNPKQVHSLTARSISKEFREGLKKNSYQRVVKIDRAGSGESEQSEVYSADKERPETPPIDLRSTKKFWEDIIQRQKLKKI